MDPLTVPAGTMGAGLPATGDSLLRTYWRRLRRDLALHLFVLGYALAAWLLATGLGVPHRFAPLTYLPMTLTALPVGAWLVVLVLALRSLGAPRPMRALRDRMLRIFDPDVVAGLALFGSLSVFIGIFSSVKTMMTVPKPFFADHFLSDVDRMLHFGRDPWVFTRLPAGLTNALELVYAPGWGIVLMATLLAVLLVPRLQSERRRFVWAFLVTWPLLGNVVAWAGLSAGPTFYAWVTGDGRFAELTQHLDQVSILQKHVRLYLWNAYVDGTTGAGAGISAFPSMHVATATLVALLAARVNRGWTWAGLLFLATIQFGSVHLGWHYAVDGYCSMLVTTLVWVALGRQPAGRPAQRPGAATIPPGAR